MLLFGLPGISHFTRVTLYFKIGFNTAFLFTPTFPKASVTFRELVMRNSNYYYYYYDDDDDHEATEVRYGVSSSDAANTFAKASRPREITHILVINDAFSRQ